MGKKKHGKKDKHRQDGHRQDGAAATRPAPSLQPLAGLAATLARQVDSPEGRRILASGLTMAAAAASAALLRHSGEAATPSPSTAAPTSPTPPTPPTPPIRPTGPSHDDLGAVLGKAAEQMLGRLFAGKK
jgi:hypothetical protein